MSHINFFLAVLLTVGLLDLGAFSQSGVEDFETQLGKATRAAEIEQVLTAAEKGGLPRKDLINLRYRAYLDIPKSVALRSVDTRERNDLARLAITNENALIKSLERHLEELEGSAADIQEISSTAVQLAQILTASRIFEESARARLAFAKQRAERVRSLYGKALGIEQKVDPSSPNSLALMALLADEHMRSSNFEEALPLFEQYLSRIEAREGKQSPARVRALRGITEIAEIAGDTRRFDKLKNEMALLGSPYEGAVSINSRAEPGIEGVEDRGGLVRLETSSPIRLRTSDRDRIKPGTEKVTLQSPDMLIRLDPVLKIVKTSRSEGHPAIVSVDTAGNVLDVEVVSSESPKEKVIAMVKRWKFRPLAYNGLPSPMKGLIYCWIVN